MALGKIRRKESKMSKKILIADDEPHILQLLASRLKANNYTVVAAMDGMNTIRTAHMEQPDLILLDIKMPAGSGVSVFETLKKSVKTLTIPVIFITAHPSEEIRKMVLEMGAEDFIAKPFDSEELLKKIKKVLGEEVDLEGQDIKIN